MIAFRFILLFALSSSFLYAKSKKHKAFPFWFKGSVEQAFDQAHKEGKNLFLYWGAVWCPPCNKVKNQVFKKKAFQEEIKNFIPVYLDGDTKRAQVWGEKLKAKGYPTLMVLNSNKKELTRISPDLRVDEFVNALKKVKSSSQVKITTLLRKLKSRTPLSKSAWQKLSDYSWEQDHYDYLGQEDIVKHKNIANLYYQSLNQENENITNRFALLFLDSFSSNNQQLTKQDLKSLSVIWQQIFKSKKTIKPFIGQLSSSYMSFTKLLKQKPNLEQINTIKSFYSDASLPLGQRLYSLYPYAVLKKQNGHQLETRTQKIVSQIDNDEEFQATMSSVIYFHYQLENYDYAIDQATYAVGKSKSPFYFMNYLAFIYKKLNKPKMVLSWSKKAWEQAKGRSTIMEQAVRYLGNLAKYQQNSPSIEKSFHQFLTHMASNQSLIQGRGKSYMKRLKTSFSSLSSTKKDSLHKTGVIYCKAHQLKCDPTFKLLF